MATMPYLSVVAVAEGSETPGFAERWMEQAGRHWLSSEVIAVAADSRSRNSGIRRARGEFVLATTAGTVFPDELIEFLAARRLQKNRLYRADRYDASRVWAREGVFPLTGDGLRANSAEDITTAGSGIHFGPGWFPAVRLAGRIGRFLGNDAEVALPGMPRRWAAMDLEMEPGPGVGQPPATLQAVDCQGRVAAEWEIARRTALRIWIPPAEDGGMQRFRLRAPQGGLPTPLDLHIFNFRCLLADWAAQRPPAGTPSLKELIDRKRPTLRRFLTSRPWRAPWVLRLLGSLSHGSECRTLWRTNSACRVPTLRDASRSTDRGPARRRGTETARHPDESGCGTLESVRHNAELACEKVGLGSVGTDVFGPGIEYWGEGWSYREEGGGETFRWAAQDAELVVRLDGESGNLAMLVEPGPGVGGRFVLRVRLPDGTVLGRAEVRGASYVRIPLPKFGEPIVRLFVGPEGGASVVEGDSRVLGFRVFGCACQAVRSARGRKTMPPPGHWIWVTRGTEPVTVDWTEKLRDCQGQIAEMGKPEDLHLQACANFTLMARDHWLDLRGFPELDLPQAELEALLCLAAHQAGIREEVLPYSVSGGEGQPLMETGDDALWIGTQMRRLHAPAIFNLDDWGAR